MFFRIARTLAKTNVPAKNPLPKPAQIFLILLLKAVEAATID
jgi:hypothetical protein